MLRTRRSQTDSSVRILVAHPSTELYGADLLLTTTVEACVNRGASVTAVVPHDGPLVSRLTALGARVIVRRMPVVRKAHLHAGGVMSLALLALSTLIDQVRLCRKHDVVYVNTITIPTWLLAGRIARRRTVLHVREAEDGLGKATELALYGPSALATSIICNSRFSASLVARTLPMTRRKTTVVYNGVKDRSEVSSPVPREPRRGAVLALVGRISPRKGADIAIEALAQLRAEGRDVVLQLAGTAFTGYEWFEEELHALAQKRGVSGAVTFLGYADAFAVLGSADIALMPSRVEPFGNVAVEAMLASCPLVATKTQGLAEIVRDESTGLTCDVEDADGLARAIRRLLDDPLWAQTIAARARKDALERFSPERYASEIWSRIVGGSVPHRRACDEY